MPVFILPPPPAFASLQRGPLPTGAELLEQKTAHLGGVLFIFWRAQQLLILFFHLVWILIPKSPCHQLFP